MPLKIDRVPVPQSSPRVDDDRGGVVVPLDTIVLHWTAGRGDAYTAARYFKNLHRFGDVVRRPTASYHYTIGRDGLVVQLVDDSRAAWHAGDGDGRLWDRKVTGDRRGRPANLRSIGIALCNRGPMPVAEGGVAAEHDKPGITWTSFEPYPEAQVETLRALLAELAAKHQPKFICGHADITHGKGDPGPLLPWDRLGLDDLGVRRVRRMWPGSDWTPQIAPT